MNIINRQKCGDIFLVKPSTYNFVCCYCVKDFTNFISFRDHIEINHFTSTQKEESVGILLKEEFTLRNSEESNNTYAQILVEKHEEIIKIEQVESIEESWLDECITNLHENVMNASKKSCEENLSIKPSEQQIFNSSLQIQEKSESIYNEIGIKSNIKSAGNKIESLTVSEENSLETFFTEKKSDIDSDKNSNTDNDKTMIKGYSKRAMYCSHCQYEYKIYQNHDKKKCADIQQIIKCYNKDYEALKKEGIFLCKDCPRYFDESKKLTFHRRCHYNSGTCPICLKHVKHLDVHTRSQHPGEKYVKSKIVDEPNENSRILQCSYCDKIFKKEISLGKHEQCHLNDSLKCNYCDRHFKRSSLLKNHLRTHTGEKPYQCSQCPAAFAIKRNLTTHFIYKHTEETPYACRYEGGCGKSFKTKDLCNIHERRHTQSIEYQCEICGVHFNEKPKLKMHHKRMHLDYNLRPHHCKFCDKKFVKKNYLREHERTHTGEKPIKCDLCPSTFARNRSLREHKKLHSDEKKHVCKICGKPFAQYVGYSNHMKNHP